MDNREVGAISDFVQKPVLDMNNFNEAIEFVLMKVEENLREFTEDFPCSASENLIYHPIKNTSWDTSFWTGILWLAYEVSGNMSYRSAAEMQLNSYKERLEKKDKINEINIGRLYTLSSVAEYKVTGNEAAKNLAIEAADRLLERFIEKVQFISALREPSEQEGTFIEIPSLIDLSLLYWATIETGDRKYYNIAEKHLNQVIKYNIREDGSTFHQYYIDVDTGKPLYGANIAGYSNQSCWARGHALGIYGLVLNYIYTGNVQLLELAKRTTNYFLSHLPEDGICYWDLFFTDGEEPRDTSAAVIAANAMLELAKYLPIMDENKYIYENAAIKILNKLISAYTTNNVEYSDSNGILMGGVYRRPFYYGENECLLIGEYFYFETLIKATRYCKLYW